MIGIIVFIVLIIILAVISYKYLEDWTAFTTILIGALFMLIITDACIQINLTETSETSELVASQEIIALKDNSLTSGSFFLGSGCVGQDEYYVYCSETKYGYKTDKLSADNERYPVYIKYIPSTELPHIDRYAIVSRTKLTKTPNIWFSIIGYIRYSQYKVGDIVSEKVEPAPLYSSTSEYFDNYRYEIYIPEGSIQENYEIDLE